MSTSAPANPSTGRRLLAALAAGLAAGLVAGLAPGMSPVSKSAASASATEGSDEASSPGSEGSACAAPVFDDPVRAAVAERRDEPAFAAAERRNEARGVDLENVAEDADAWLDECGRAFYADPVREPAPTAAAAEAPVAAAGEPAQVAALAETFALRSKPGSARTIYLDFTGGQVAGTAWNNQYGASIPVAPYSRDDAVDTNYSASELLDIQQTWALVAADYAPFDIDVTTRWPGQDALTRSGAADTTYGSQVRITNGGAIYDRCRCGGIAYVNVFGATYQHAYHQPAFVFASGTGRSGKTIGEAVSHEVGHNLGLSHDATTSSGYYAGSRPWAPIMGAGYYQPVTQWSRGEYSGASNKEDDLSIIARSAPLVADDHGATRGSATTLSGPGDTTGRITTRGDKDAFTFTGAGKTIVTVSGGGWSDLDISLKVLDESGSVVATANPGVISTGATSVAGLDATWTAMLPTSGATRTVVVDGVGQGTLPSAGAYSDYASLGRYNLNLSTSAPAGAADVLRAAATRVPGAVRTRSYSARPVTVAGGSAPYAWSATGLPAGLRISPGTGALSGAPTRVGAFSATVRVVDATGRAVAISTRLTVADLPPLVLHTRARALPRGEVGTRYRAVVRTRGGEGALAWRGVRGTRPPGLRRGATTGGRLVISGKPRRATTRTVVLAATDTAGRTVRRGFRLRIL